MVLKEEDLQQLKEVELEMFKAFISVCEQLGLRYYLLGGTLLGAVRHKGFIPWDDDIDVGMPRADYEIFLEKAQALMPAPYFVQNLRTEKTCPFNFCKIRNSNTTYLESSVAHLPINHGVFIDIFPLDGYPTKQEEKAFFRTNTLLSWRIQNVFGGPVKKPWWKKLISVLLMPISVEQAVQKRETLYCSASNTEKTANYSGAWGAKEIVPTEWYAEGCEVEFEGLAVRAPKEYDKWLTQVYGDYMQLPPEEKRVGHHYVDVFDLNASYVEYVSKGEKK